MVSKKTLLIVHPYFRKGGVEQTLIRLIPSFVAAGFHTEVLTFKSMTSHKKTVEDMGCKWIEFKNHRMLSMVTELVRYIRINKFQHLVVLSNQNYVNVCCCLLKIFIRKPFRLVLTDRNHPVELRMKSGLLMRIKGVAILLGMKIFYPLCDRAITISTEMYEIISSFAPHKTVLIFNPSYDRTVIEKSKAPLTFDLSYFKNQKIFITAARLEEQKDLESLLHSFALVENQISSILLILGDGPLYGVLSCLATKLGIYDKVHFLGHLENPFPLIANSDCFVLSSRWEGFGNVLVEALTLERPVVATACLSGPRDILLNGCGGWLVPVGDIREIAHAMVEAVTNVELACDKVTKGVAGLTRFKREDVAEQYIAILNGKNNLQN